MFNNLAIHKHWASYLCTQKCVSSLSFSSQIADWIFSALTVTRNLYRIVNLLDWDQAPSLTFWPRIDPSCARVRDEARRHFFPFLWSKFSEKCSWPPKSWPTKYVPGVFFPQCSRWWESRGLVIKYKWEMNSTNVNGILQWSFKGCVSRDHCEKPSSFVTCALPTLQWRESIYQEKLQDSVHRLEIWMKMDFFFFAIVVCLITVNYCLWNEVFFRMGGPYC